MVGFASRMPQILDHLEDTLHEASAQSKLLRGLRERDGDACTIAFLLERRQPTNLAEIRPEVSRQAINDAWQKLRCRFLTTGFLFAVAEFDLHTLPEYDSTVVQRMFHHTKVESHLYVVGNPSRMAQNLSWLVRRELTRELNHSSGVTLSLVACYQPALALSSLGIAVPKLESLLNGIDDGSPACRKGILLLESILGRSDSVDREVREVLKDPFSKDGSIWTLATVFRLGGIRSEAVRNLAGPFAQHVAPDTAVLTRKVLTSALHHIIEAVRASAYCSPKMPAERHDLQGLTMALTAERLDQDGGLDSMWWGKLRVAFETLALLSTPRTVQWTEWADRCFSRHTGRSS